MLVLYMANVFLTAEWRKLAMANYRVDPDILKPYLPAGTALDFWNGGCYVSLVGFMFQETRLKGIKVPFHVNFEEVNLRFYVTYTENNTVKRGVVFISEIVPKPALAWVANTLYKEHYTAMPMKHQWDHSASSLKVSYAWKKDRWHQFSVETTPTAFDFDAQSEDAFITEHYWGYSRMNDRKSVEYAVEHPKWQVYQTLNYDIDVDFGKLYGSAFQHVEKEKPHSVFLAEGSAVRVLEGGTIHV